MKYMLLIHQDDAPRPRREGEGNEQAVAAFEALSQDEQMAIYRDYGAINQTPGVTPGLELRPPDTATTIRVENGKTLATDGPFAETKEALGGFLVFEADSFEAAVDLASRIPAARLGGAVEIRETVER